MRNPSTETPGTQGPEGYRSDHGSIAVDLRKLSETRLRCSRSGTSRSAHRRAATRRRRRGGEPHDDSGAHPRHLAAGPPVAGPEPSRRRAGRAAPGRDDPRGEGRAARQSLGGQRHGSATPGRSQAWSGTPPSTSRRCRTSSRRPGRRRWRRPPGTGSATSPGSTAALRSPRRRGRRISCASSGRSWPPVSASRRSSTRSASPASRPSAPRSTPRPSRGRPPSTRSWSSGWPRRSDGTWRPSACTRGSRRCSTSCVTTGGGASRRRSARTPTSCRVLGAAYVRGLQSAGVVATLKHFAGYSASRGARNHGPVSMGRRELLDVILPPFEMAVALGRGRLGDELLLGRRRRARGRRPVVADASCCARSGGSTARSSPTTGRSRSWPRCTGSPRTTATPARWRSPRASTSSCPTPSASARRWSSGSAAARSPRSWSTGRRGGC